MSRISSVSTEQRAFLESFRIGYSALLRDAAINSATLWPPLRGVGKVDSVEVL